MIFTISPDSESTEACETKIGLTKVRREERPAFEGGEREKKKTRKIEKIPDRQMVPRGEKL